MSINKTTKGYAAIVAIGLTLIGGVYFKTNKDYNSAIDRYKTNSMAEAEQAKQKLERALTQVYQNIRTISFLPSVKKIDRHGTNLDADGLQSIQQIYNNLASNVAVSEVYIVPKDLNPDIIDPTTNSPEVPTLMFDTLIVDPSKKQDEGEDAPPAHEEVEIYEYHLLQEQMEWLQKNYPTASSSDGLNVPMLAGKEVITCDNTDYDNTLVDSDRSGPMFSVPFYSEEGILKGAVTAVIRTNAIKNLMPATNYALVNKGYGYAAYSKNGGLEATSKQAVSDLKPDSNLIFSAVLPIETADKKSDWNLWVGYPDEKFLESGDAKAVRNFEYAGYSFALILIAAGSAVWSFMQRNFRAIEENNLQLEKKIAERTAEIENLASQQEASKAESEKQKRESLNKMANQFEESVKSVVSQVASSSTQIQSNSEGVTQIAADTKKRSNAVAKAAANVAKSSQQVSAAAEEMSASINEISSQTQMSKDIANEASHKASDAKTAIESLAEKSSKVSAIIEVIGKIAGQINLLALNATIESARAGEAGKGFAVVASEVKQLATQVAKASEEISKQISDMQGATKLSVDTVLGIIDIINQVSSSSSAVAAAVEEQSAVTNEIAKNVSETATGTEEISRNIGSVQDGADQTGESAAEVLKSSKNLNTLSALLQDKVDEFLKTIRS